MSNNIVHQAVKPLAWLIGRWRSITAEGFYPTIKPFKYCDEITFENVGQPYLIFTSNTWDPISGSPIHLERGFLRFNPGTDKLAFVLAHGLGVVSVEEGEIFEDGFRVKSTHVSSMSFVRDPLVRGLEREIRINKEGKLEISLSMETEKTPLTQHLKAVYENVK